MRRVLAAALLLAGCADPYDVRLSDGRSASFGPLFFFGWADPPLIPGTRLIDAPPGSRLVLWNEAGLEAIVDLGDECPVIVREGEGARAPTDVELAVLADVFPGWPLVASTRPREYAAETRLDRKFPSHIRTYAESLETGSLVSFAIGDSPAAWLDLGGRVLALGLAAQRAPAGDLGRLVDRAVALEGADRSAALRAIASRPELAPADLVRIAGVEPGLAVAHPAATAEVCFAAIVSVAGERLSSERRKGLEKILESPGVTPEVRQRVLAVPLGYEEDREAIRKKASD